MYQRANGLGLIPFIMKAETKIIMAVNDYEFDRYLSKDKNIEENLQKANERVFAAIQERDTLADLHNRLFIDETDED